jgi:AcrR family transcriptional regulator
MLTLHFGPVAPDDSSSGVSTNQVCCSTPVGKTSAPDYPRRHVRSARFDPAEESAGPAAASGAPALTSRRETNIRKRKQRILDCATRLIATEGIAACTMRRLARRARLDVTTLYNYYGSKEQILEALRRAGARRVHRQVEELREREPIDRIRAIVRVTLGTRESPPDLARPLNLTIPSRRPGEGPIAAAARGALVPELERAIAGGLLDPALDPGLLATSILESFHPWLELWAAGTVEADEFSARIEHSVSLCLAAAATERSRRRLLAELRASQRRLRPLAPNFETTRGRRASAPSLGPASSRRRSPGAKRSAAGSLRRRVAARGPEGRT